MKVKFILTLTFMAILLITFMPTTAAATNPIEITNLSRETYTFTNQQLTEMPQTTVYAELYCYGNLVESGDWSGVQLNYLLTQTNVTSDVKSILFTASDAYTVIIPMQLAVAPETIIAYQKNGVELTGLRLVLPGVNGASWINQIVTISMGVNEVDTPAAASGPGARGNLIENLIGNSQPPPAPTLAPNQTQPTPKPTLGNSTINQVVPQNTSQTNQTPGKQTERNQKSSLDSSTIALIATVFAASSAIAAFFVYKNKTKLKNNTH
jgi:hypothetical protein